MDSTAKQRHGNELYDVEDPGLNDVLFGRGTGSNQHTGNIRFRALIQKYKPVYRDTPKKMKPSVSTKVVSIWRSQNPPGRFLTRSDRFQGSRRTFYDVGDAMARRKAAQCLREKSSKERILHQQQQAGEKRPLEEEGSEEMVAEFSTSHEEGRDEPHSTLFSGGDDALFPGLGGSLRADQDVPAVTSSMEQGEEQGSQLESNKAKKDIDVIAMVTSANLDEQFGSSSATIATTKDPLFELPNLKTKKGAAGWLACGSSNNDPMSLITATYESNLKEVPDTEEDRNGTSESPFLFASFDFEGNQGDTNSGDGGGLCFPSLFGGDSGNTTSSLFGDDNSSSSLFGGGASSPFPFGEPTETPPLPPVLPPSIPKATAKENVLQNIRDSMPTAASLLTTNLFD